MAKKDMILTVQTGNVSYNLNTSAIDTSKIKAFLGNADSTAVVVQPDGSLRHVPTKVKVVNGKVKHWCFLKTGIITGRSSTTLAPKDVITRAEVAAVVQRLLQKSNLI